MLKIDASEVYRRIRYKPTQYEEEVHCTMILAIMANPKRGTVSSFCVEAMISEHTFYQWLNRHEIFKECYYLGRAYAKEIWEAMGREISEELTMPGSSNHKFEHWRMMGWARFGIGKNSRIRLNLNANDAPNKHYGQLLQQASDGDFTAGEIKQLMEAVNVGLNTHQVFTLQKEIDQLKFDLNTMSENSGVHNTLADKRSA